MFFTCCCLFFSFVVIKIVIKNIVCACVHASDRGRNSRTLGIGATITIGQQLRPIREAASNTGVGVYDPLLPNGDELRPLPGLIQYGLKLRPLHGLIIHARIQRLRAGSLKSKES